MALPDVLWKQARNVTPWHFVRALTVIVAVTMVVPIVTAQAGSGSAAPSGECRDRVAEAIRARMESRGATQGSWADDSVEYHTGWISGGDALHAVDALPVFYERRGFLPAWCDGAGDPVGVDALLEVIRAVRDDGLRPADYHLPAIEAQRQITPVERAGAAAGNAAGSLADLDLLLTDAYMIVGSHLLSGRINPETIDAEWSANRRGADLAAVLAAAVRSGDVAESLWALAPRQAEYARLKALLVRYRVLAASGGWPHLTVSGALKAGTDGPEVDDLRRRLLAGGDLVTSDPEVTTVFDEAVEQAVLRFQHRHGLEVDGVAGPATLRALNVPAADRVRQIELNLERWRWLPEALGPRHVRVNIADFRLEVFEHGQRVLDMKAIVGKTYRRTPVFSDAITYLVLNPCWFVPDNLAQQDILPQVVKDPGFLERHRITVYRGWGAQERRVDPSTIDWRAIAPTDLSLRFVQAPGGTNPLGKIKFMFPNKYSIYLHDTATPQQFGRTVRSLSSGCIRIERPVELAWYLLQGNGRWTRADLEAAIAAGTERTVRLPAPVPVHLLYFTAWVDEDGVAHFREDIYGRDQNLENALRARS